MRKLQVLGPGCPKCRTLMANVQAAVEELGIEAEVNKVEDIGAIAAMGVLMTPALVVDGQVRSSGSLLSVHQIKKLLS
jgi:small redox-active disulfide protein 2